MEITRKQLNQILINLPHPRMVEEGRIAPTYQVPIFNMDSLITDDVPPYQFNKVVEKLIFKYSYKEMDWILQID